MSLIDDRYRCPDCNGYTNHDAYRLKLSSRCRCNETPPKGNDKKDD